jgi:hypothetical protein
MAWGAIAAIAGQVLGTYLDVYGARTEGKQAAKLGRYQQLMAERAAKATERTAIHDIRLLKEQGRRLKARQIVNIAAGGGKLTGTNLKALVQSAAAVEADAAIIASNAAFDAQGIRYEGAMARYRGRMARFGSRIRVATTIGKGAGNAYMMGMMGGGGKKSVSLGRSGGVGSLRGRNLNDYQRRRPWAGGNIGYQGGMINA